VADLRFLLTAMLVALLKGGISFDEVVEAGFGEVIRVIDLEVVLPDSSACNEVINCGWGQYESCSFTYCGAYIREGGELQLQMMIPVGYIVDGEKH